MEIKGKVHCFFEQSGTFKNEFKKLGIEAYDYDIQDNFDETDNVIDLFAEIEAAYMGGASVFDEISKDDLIMAFFPCIYFESVQQCYYSMESGNLDKNPKIAVRQVVDRVVKRNQMYLMLWKLTSVCIEKELRFILENPAMQPHFLLFTQNYLKPSYIDKDRTRRGDFYKKPTAYWFVNCNPTFLFTYNQTKKSDIKTIKKAKSGIQSGICSEERSMISPTYAHNFICDNILGIEQEYIGKQLELF